MTLRSTRINAREVPIAPGGPTIVCFSRGRLGEHESGAWEFWTVYRTVGNRRDKQSVRCRPGCDPGQRFRETRGRQGEEKTWEVAAAAEGIRSSTPKEVIGWLTEHEGDVAEWCLIGGKTMRVVKDDLGKIQLMSQKPRQG